MDTSTSPDPKTRDQDNPEKCQHYELLKHKITNVTNHRKRCFCQGHVDLKPELLFCVIHCEKSDAASHHKNLGYVV